MHAKAASPKAAARFGISQSALSHTIRQLEARLGIRLLTRTTRAVAPTEAGERLLERIGPHFDRIEIEVDALNELKDKPAGTVRIVAPDFAISHVLWPKVQKFLPKYPDIKVELLLDNGLSDIVTERYDAGVRIGRPAGEGHDLGAHRTGFPLRRRRREVLFCRSRGPGKPTGPNAA